MSTLLNRLVSGDGIRKTRLHDYGGRRIDLAGLRYLPRAACSVLLWKAFRVRSSAPWLGYRGVRFLDALIHPAWNVLEFGSGTSTLWLTRRCKRLTSVESNRSWYDNIESRLQRANLWADYRYCPVERYGEFGEIPSASFDLVIVDGVDRALEARRAIEAVKPGGYVFYDNSDVQLPEYVEARNLLANLDTSPRFFRDFCPGQISVTESMLVHAPG